MAKVEANKLIRKLQQLENKYGASTDVCVGFSQRYALHVHEDLQAHHVVGQAKFLETPYRRMRKQLVTMVRNLLKQGVKLETALMKAGLLLQREAQSLCPVDTGALRASAYTALTKNVAAAAARAFAVSEALRRRKRK